jgi:hypothetical protein
MKNQLQGKQGLWLTLSIVTGALITLFLSGKIIEIPKGTNEGGIVGATGVAIIIVSMIVIGMVVNKLIKNPR